LEIVLVRHAQPDWEPDGRAVDDPGLTDYGHAQARCVAEALADEHFDQILMSTHPRVVETAAPVLERLGLPGRRVSWLREMTLSSLEGSTTEQVRAYFEHARSRALSSWWDGMPGGESFRHFYERVSRGLEGVLAEHHRVSIHDDETPRLWQIPDPERRLLIFAHEGTNAVLVSHLLGIPPVAWAHLQFSSSWAGISRVHSVEITGGSLFALDAFNRVDHLFELEAHARGSGRSFTG
jgi:broad specificity phosphatase PhoE